MNSSNFRSDNPRRLVFYIGFLLMFLVLFGGFYNLQIFQGREYQEKSLRNSIKVETRTPLRGLIYDREDNLIADNRPSFSIYLIPAQTKEKTVTFLSEVLDIPVKTIKRKMRGYSRRFQPVKIARYVDRQTLSKIQENKADLPGLDWRVEPRRNYVMNRSFAHVLGTLGEVADNDLQKDSNYEPGDVVGKKGIEKVLDQYLRGSKGYRYVKVDAFGRTVETMSSEKNRAPEAGHDLHLTIDADLQAYADSLFQDKTGALVAVDVRNGEVLTLVSKPNYDLDAFAEAVQQDVWRSLMADSLKPLFDRAGQGTYPPGSTYKMVAAIAALNEDIVAPSWKVYCSGSYRIGRRIVRCWNLQGHGEVEILKALAQSCNVYFYQLGLKIGIDHWNHYSKMFLFGERTNVELSGEKSGLLPSKRYYDRVFGEGNWTAGMLANIAIGQGELLVTPLQMARFTMMLANSGEYYQLHLLRKLVNKMDGSQQNFDHEPQYITGIDTLVMQTIREGMRRVVAGGTGSRAGVWQMTGGGKTGTAQNPHGKPHAWYIGFAPFEEPEIAVALIVENGGGGGGVAAPMAGKYLRRYFHKLDRFDYAAEAEFLRKLWVRRQQQAQADSLQKRIEEQTNRIIETIPLRRSQ